MKRIILVFIFLAVLTVSCISDGSRIFFWKCPSRILYLNTLDTSFVSSGIQPVFDVYMVIHHPEEFAYDSLSFSLGINDFQSTVKVKLVNDLGNNWNGIQRIGASEYRVRIIDTLSFEEGDTVRISITPLASEAIEGVDWIALELKKLQLNE